MTSRTKVGCVEPSRAVRLLSPGLAIAGHRVRGMFSAEHFAREVGFASAFSLVDACQRRWKSLAVAIALAPEPLEVLLVIANAGRREGPPTVSIDLLGVGRGTGDAAATRARQDAHTLGDLVRTSLDFVEVEPLGSSEVAEVGAVLLASRVVEIRRRALEVPVADGSRGPTSVGFGPLPDAPSWPRRTVRHVFPWSPSDDPWHRLIEVLLTNPPGSAYVAHVQGGQEIEGRARTHSTGSLAYLERLSTGEKFASSEVPLQSQIEFLHSAALRRQSILYGPVLAGRVFVVGPGDGPTPSLLATIASGLDEPTPVAEAVFHGGVEYVERPAGALLAHLGGDPEELFGPAEATAFLRTPVPTTGGLAGIAMLRSKTAPVVGRSGQDVSIGYNLHQYDRVEILLDEAMRCRHAYVIGQTGAGKSTLLLNMILQDIERGRGVAVLDPHGSLVQDVLERMPRERTDDVVVFDVTDTRRPISFNVLRIPEIEPENYRFARDLLIDEIYSFFESAYDMTNCGGPMFETHFRGMLALLLGVEPPSEPRIPNLMLFRSLYGRKDLRDALITRQRGRDPFVDDFVAEATRAGGEISLPNIAPYITSKFNRFVANTALRNILCQNEALDLSQIVRERKILVCDLGRGRFGDQAAGLIASQLVARTRRAVMGQGTQAHVPFHLYADEFQLFADDRFAELLAEARKFGLSLTLAHQHLGQLPQKVMDAVLGNIGTVISFRVGPPDADRLAPLFAPSFGGGDLVALENFSACVRSSGQLGQSPFSLSTQSPGAAVDRSLADSLRERSSALYGRCRDEAELEISQTYNVFLELTGECRDQTRARISK